MSLGSCSAFALGSERVWGNANFELFLHPSCFWMLRAVLNSFAQ